MLTNILFELQAVGETIVKNGFVVNLFINSNLNCSKNILSDFFAIFDWRRPINNRVFFNTK